MIVSLISAGVASDLMRWCSADNTMSLYLGTTFFSLSRHAAEAAPHEGKRKNESLWPIFRIHHQRSRYVYEMYAKKKAISKELYDYCCREGYADANLIAKWKKPGYERLCCLRCMQTKEHNYGTTCFCRVPKRDLEAGRIVECTQCGCRGCASGDGAGGYVLEVVAEQATEHIDHVGNQLGNQTGAATSSAGDDKQSRASDGLSGVSSALVPSGVGGPTRAPVFLPPTSFFPPMPFGQHDIT